MCIHLCYIAKMDIYELARSGDIDELQMALLEDGECVDMTELAAAAIEGDQLDMLKFLLENGVSHSEYLYDLALSMGRRDILEYLERKIDEEGDHLSNLDEMVIEDNINAIKDMVRDKAVSADDIAEAASRYSNMCILRYALKHGADDYDRMIDAAVDNDHFDIVTYLEELKESEMWYSMKNEVRS